jgi:hypothetical protein
MKSGQGETGTGWKEISRDCSDPAVAFESRIFASFDDNPECRLGELCLRLLDEQKRTWTDCRRGYETLERVGKRIVQCDGFSVTIQHNPGRVASTEARVEKDDIALRPCFLCTDRLPADQKVVLYRRDYVVLCNPMPVFSSHYTVAHRQHRPQTIGENVATLLRLVDDFGEGWTVLYNGPRCGASAPDHLHFQVVTGASLSIENEIAEEGRLLLMKQIGDARVYRAGRLGREVLVLESNSSGDLITPFFVYSQALTRVLAGRSDPTQIEGGRPEPMLNLAAFVKGKKVFLLVFPRGAHRPAAFFLSGEERIAVSPAVAEMGGIIVTPVERDFSRLTSNIVEGIYREVSIDANTARQAIEAMQLKDEG